MNFIRYRYKTDKSGLYWIPYMAYWDGRWIPLALLED